MRRKIEIENGNNPVEPDPRPEAGAAKRSGNGADEEPTFKFTDKRRWTQGDEAQVDEVEPARPTVIDEFRQRAEEAERRLQEYIEAHKQFRAEQEQVRVRLQRDVDRRVELKFAEVVGALLETVDNLDFALQHTEGVEAAGALAEGVRLARDRFLATLERSGVERVSLDGEPFDPNMAEAVRLDPVATQQADGTVTETLRPGYRLGDTLVRAAQVAVGRFTPAAG